jgi:hypothetical protein
MTPIYHHNKAYLLCSLHLIYTALSPDLNCDDIDDNNFKVLLPDPPGFDSEGDGIGCEA